MLTGIAAIIVGYLGGEGASFAITKLFSKSDGGSAMVTPQTVEKKDLYWALEKVDQNKLSDKEKEKYDNLWSFIQTP